ncbi:hypothetical protein CFP56_039325, partial [Quercus suber]
EKTNSIGREIVWGRQQNTTTVQIVQGIRLWFLHGVAEGFICVYSVTEGSATDRAGLGNLFEEAIAFAYLLVISRLEGKSVMPPMRAMMGFQGNWINVYTIFQDDTQFNSF